MARRASMVCSCDRPTSFRWTLWVAAGTLLSWQNTGSNLPWFTLELMAQDEEAAPKGHLTPCAHTSYGVSTWYSWLRLLHGGLSQSAYSAFVTFCSFLSWDILNVNTIGICGLDPTRADIKLWQHQACLWTFGDPVTWGRLQQLPGCWALDKE